MEESPLITATSLREHTVKDLGQMAKDKGVSGWHSMRKDQLIRALVRLAKANARKRASAKSKSSPAASKARSTAKARAATGVSVSAKSRASKRQAGKSRSAKPQAAKPRTSKSQPRASSASKTARRRPSDAKSAVSARVAKRIGRERDNREKEKDLAQKNAAATKIAPRRAPVIDDDQKDRLVLMVRDAYWLHAYWEVSRHSVVRAKAAMAERWHTCKPVLRLFHVESSGANSGERVARDIEIHGGVKNWYIDVADPPESYRVELGYLATDGHFFAIARSNTVKTPRPGSSDAIDENWTDIAENYEKIYAQSITDGHSMGDLRELFEERLRRPMGASSVSSYGVGAARLLRRDNDFEFEVDAELILFGKTKPDAHVALRGEPVKLRPDGTFTVRLSMPDRRQVLPVVASSMDGVQQRTVVLAVERNTKVMDPVVRENGA
jgi:hypothetical protein